jgi:hypothetical protein
MEEYERGIEIVLELEQRYGIRRAWLLKDSPSVTAFHLHTRCPFGRFWHVIPFGQELNVHENERLISSIIS